MLLRGGNVVLTFKTKTCLPSGSSPLLAYRHAFWSCLVVAYVIFHHWSTQNGFKATDRLSLPAQQLVALQCNTVPLSSRVLREGYQNINFPYGLCYAMNQSDQR